MSRRIEARILQYLREQKESCASPSVPPQCAICNDEGTVLSVVLRLEASEWRRTLAQRSCVCQLPPFDPGAFDALIAAAPSRPMEVEE